MAIFHQCCVIKTLIGRCTTLVSVPWLGNKLLIIANKN
jgi:hypothetical protein